MFCINCGKQIIDTAHFCNYCGRKVVEFDENQGAVSTNFTENPAPLTENSVLNAENVENSGNLLKMTDSVSSYVPQMNEPPKSGYSPDSIPSDVQSGAVGAQRSAIPSETGIPATGDPALSGNPVPPAMGDPAFTGNPVPPAMGDPAFTGNPVPPAMGDIRPLQPEHKYTIGHLIMCLASTAVMAIVAGVFAGLYFSVV